MYPQRGKIVLCDLAQDAAHDLAGACFRQAWGELDLVGRSDRADFGADMADQRLAQLVRALHARHQRHIAVDALTLDIPPERSADR